MKCFGHGFLSGPVEFELYFFSFRGYVCLYYGLDRCMSVRVLRRLIFTTSDLLSSLLILYKPSSGTCSQHGGLARFINGLPRPMLN